MDPLTALGLVGNLVQIISFSTELVTEGNKIYRDASGALEHDKVADEVAGDLSLLTERLRKTQDKWLASHPQAQLDPDELRLRNLCDRCIEIAVELQVQLSKLKVKDGKMKRLRSYKQALISVWRREAVEDIAQRLEKYQRELATRIIFGLRNSLRDADIKNTEQFALLDQQAKDLTNAVLKHDSHLDSKLDDHTSILSRIVTGQERTHQMLLAMQSWPTSTQSPEPPSYGHATTGLVVAAQTSPLHKAAEAGDVLKVRQLLRDPAIDINVRDGYGSSPLHVASNVDVAKRLLADKRIDLHAEDYEGRTVLHVAVLKRNLGVVKALLEAGVDTRWEDDSGKTAAFYAQDCPAASFMLKYGHETEAKAKDFLSNTGLLHLAWLGDLEGTEFYLSQGASVNARNEHGESGLTEACRHGETNIVALLLQHGEDLEIATADEWTSLLQAIRDGREAVVRLLLMFGAKKDAKLRSGNDCLAEACSRKHFGIARLLIEEGAYVNTRDHEGAMPLYKAACEGATGFVKWALGRGAEVDAANHEGHTAAYACARRGHSMTLDLLLQHGASHRITTPENGWSCLGIAANRGHIECVKTLLKHGADPNVKGHFDHTPLAEASHNGFPDILALLMSAGGDIEATIVDGFRPLAVAAHQGNDDCVRLLHKAGASLEARGFGHHHPDWNITALMRAVRCARPSTVALLAAVGADVNTRDSGGRPALCLAALDRHAAVIRVLLANGAVVDAASESGTTALHTAASHGDVEIVRSLIEAGANVRLRDSRGCTAWTCAVHCAEDSEELRALLQPASQDETLLRPTCERQPSEIAAHLRKVYR